MKSRFDSEFLEDSTEIMRAIAHPIRIAIVDLLHRETRLTVSEIHGQLDIEQAVASHHLRILKDRKVLTSFRSGKNSFYELKNKDYGSIVQMIEHINTAIVETKVA